MKTQFISITLIGFYSLTVQQVVGFIGQGSGVLVPGVIKNINHKKQRVVVHDKPQSYDVDSDEDAEQLLADLDPLEETEVINGGGVNGISSSLVSPSLTSSSSGRYGELLDSTGLRGKLNSVDGLAPKRIVSGNEVFCNRELKLSGIRAIGFDMDYTLAQYQQPAFDKLAFDGAKEKLVTRMGYPKEVLDFEYDHERWTRGLIIDTTRGNFLKIDRHKYVRVAYHGMNQISKSTRKYLYSRNFNKVPSFSEKSFVNMDTLFQFVDAHLFALLIDLKDQGEHEVLDYKTYEEIYRQIRECVDLCHRDGVIKDEVARNPDKYIVLDKGLIPMLKRYREQGVKLFLLTNSYWEYTSTAMNYLYHGKRVDDERQKENEWTELFDLVIAGSCKPAFMLDPYLQLFRVNPKDGSLKNTDGLFEIEALGENGAEKFLQQGKLFQGGNWQHLHGMLGIEAGEEILYVGDHLYADVLRSKRTLGWRSMFIMPELDDEIRVYSENLDLAKNISELRNLRAELGAYGEQIRLKENLEDPAIQKKLSDLEQDDITIKDALTIMAGKWHQAFHPVWGAMFNAGYQDSRFAFYVENYACLYTSRATNLGLSSTARSYRTTIEQLPHDRLMADKDSEYQSFDPWE